MEKSRTAYVCGPLTELPEETQGRVKKFYERIADVYEEIMGTRAFVPHEHYDPIKHAQYSPWQVDEAERYQVCKCTSVLIAVPIAGSWGGGIEVEMANRSGVPVIVLCERKKLEKRKISRLLRGNPAVIRIFAYETKKEALARLRCEFQKLLAA